MSDNNTKARFWWFTCWPDSAPSDWIEQLQFTGLPFCISPLHNRDVNADGSLKKAHYHIIIAYSGPTTYNNVKSKITDRFNAPHPQFLQSPKGAWRYLSHKDNPEKAQYDEHDIRYYNGFCISDYISLSQSDEDILYDRLEDFILENNITEFCECIFSLRSAGESQLLSFLRRHSIYFRELITSFRYSK